MKSPIIVMDIDGLYNNLIASRVKVLESFRYFVRRGYRIYLIGDRPKVGLGETTLDQIQAEVDWFMQDCFEIPTDIIFNLTAAEGTIFPWNELSVLSRPATGLLLLLEQVAVAVHGHTIDWAHSFIIYTDPKEVFTISVISPTEIGLAGWLEVYERMASGK